MQITNYDLFGRIFILGPFLSFAQAFQGTVKNGHWAVNLYWLTA